MNYYLILFFVLVSFQVNAEITPDQVEMARVKCELIKCDKMVAQEYYRCRVQEKDCYKRVFEMNMNLWTKNGINQRQRSSVLQTLEQSKRSHRQLIDRLNEEIRNAQRDILEIDLQIEAVKKLSGQR